MNVTATVWVESILDPAGHLRSRTGDAMKVLVAVDATSSDSLCVRTAVERPWPAGTFFCLLHVFNPYPFTAAPIIQERLMNKVLQNLKAAARPLRQAGWDTTTEIVAGVRRRAGLSILSSSGLKACSDVPSKEDRPYRVILSEAEGWDADLIVVGSHGRSGFDRVIMGSVSEAVALHANCSVEVIRLSEPS